jgi:hypothetical protein
MSINYTRYSLLWDVNQSKFLVICVSTLPINSTFKGQAVQTTALPLETVPTGCPETSVTNNIRCVTPQKSEYVICTTAEAWNRQYKWVCYNKRQTCT